MAGEIISVRIPSLPEQIGLKLPYKIIIFNTEEGTTKQADLSQLRTFFSDLFSDSAPPTQTGNIITVQVGASQAGGTIFSIPSLAGKQFLLRRQLLGAMPSGTWEILDAGGFKLTGAGDKLVLGETFELVLSEYITSPGGGGGGSLSIAGMRPISTNTTLVAADEGKLIQFRSNTTPISATLPELSTVTENSVWPFEANINNSYKCTIKTQSSQNIYFRNTSSQTLYIGPGESIEFIAGSDGWYTRNPYGNWAEVGEVVPGYAGGLNKILLDGSLYERAKEPRLWTLAQGLGASLVTDAVWDTASVTLSGRTIPKPYRGCFSAGNGSTTFRVPDLRGMALRGLKSGTDTERTHNIAGNYQDDMYEAHSHLMFINNGDTYTGEALSPTNHPARRQGNGTGIGNNNYEYNITGGSGTPTLGLSGASGGVETRMENVGVNWYIKS